jgi:hypothetical protein
MSLVWSLIDAHTSQRATQHTPLSITRTRIHTVHGPVVLVHARLRRPVCGASGVRGRADRLPRRHDVVVDGTVGSCRLVD